MREKRFNALFGGIPDCLTAHGFREAWFRCPMARHRKRPWPRTLGQGRTRRWRIGSQDIPGPVASQQSLPPLLLTMAFDQEAVSLCNRWTSEPCLEKSHRFTAIPPNSALNQQFWGSDQARAVRAISQGLSRVAPVRLEIKASAIEREILVECQIQDAPEGAMLSVAWVEGPSPPTPNSVEKSSQAWKPVDVVSDFQSVPLDAGFDGTIREARRKSDRLRAATGPWPGTGSHFGVAGWRVMWIAGGAAIGFRMWPIDLRRESPAC